MISALILFLIPVLLFVAAFLYETYLSFRRLSKPKAGRIGYVAATWELTNTLLVFAVVMLVMLFTQDITELSAAIFVSTFLAASVLVVRSILYCYIFYVRKSTKINWADWLFALSHVGAAGLLVVTVIQALHYVIQNKPPVNSQFLPYFIPGLLVVIAMCIVPMAVLYRTKD